MRHRCKLLAPIFLLVAAAVTAQETYHASDPNLMARLSYERSSGDGIQRICMAVFQNGNYRLISAPDSSKHFMRVEGRVVDDQFQQLKKLLRAPDFLSVSENRGGGVILDHAENFMAEISQIETPAPFERRDTLPTGPLRGSLGALHRLRWLHTDSQSSFPAPIANVINWMENFQFRNARRIDGLEMPDVCPSVGLSLVQPPMASNQHP